MEKYEEEEAIGDIFLDPSKLEIGYVPRELPSREKELEILEHRSLRYTLTEAYTTDRLKGGGTSLHKNHGAVLCSDSRRLHVQGDQRFVAARWCQCRKPRN